MDKKVDAVKMMREIRDRLSGEFATVTFEEQKRVMRDWLQRRRRRTEAKEAIAPR